MMEGGFSLLDSTVCIVGLGLMGGSLALALQGRCRALRGSDADQTILEEARLREVVTLADSDPRKVLPGSDLVILATPVPAIIGLLNELPAMMPDRCIVMDIGSAKCAITEAMMRLPERFEPVGGHPLCGKEKLSLVNAEPALYRAASFFVTPLERTTPRALSAISQVIDAIGGRQVIVSPEEHDHCIASTSHLPFLLSSALALATPQECTRFIGPGFRSASRLAGTPASMMLGVLQANRDHVLHALHGLQAELDGIELALAAEDYPKLETILKEARCRYQALVQ